MKLTLKQFMDITNNTVLEDYLCIVLVEREDENFGKITDQIKFNGNCHFTNLKELEPYYDYEVIDFYQDFTYGEVDSQELRLKK